jgi:A/G-specific adenine glycosylase
MAVLRDAEGSVPRSRLDAVWPEAAQRDRALQSLLADGLLVESDGRFALPG